MKLLTGFFLTLALAIAGAFAQAPQPLSEPLKLVRSFYVANYNAEKMPLSKRLNGLYGAAVANSKKINGPVEGLDFAWTMGAQDAPDGWERSARFTELAHEANKANVRVQFKTDRDMELIYSLVREGNAWKVDDITSKSKNKNDQWVLSQMLARGAKEK